VGVRERERERQNGRVRISNKKETGRREKTATTAPGA